MEVKLVVVGGDAKPTEINVKLPAIIGRGRSAALTLPHPLVSRQHCELFESGGKLFVRDLGSLNGTFVGEEKIEEAGLDSGSLLTIGNVTFRPIYGDQADSVNRPAEAVDFEVADDEIEEVAEVEVAEDDEEADVVDVEEVAEADPLDPPDVELRQTVKVEPDDEEPVNSAEGGTEKAPQDAEKPREEAEPKDAKPKDSKTQDTAKQDNQFLAFLDEEDEDDSGSDDDDLNAFLKGFNQ